MIRNKLYDWGCFRSVHFEVSVIGVGNLKVGGTGKTPMIEYLAGLLAPGRAVCTLSRGYGRTTSGFILADSKDNSLTIGDEPYQLFLNSKGEFSVAVGEDRVLAIPEIMALQPRTDVILLDDAFQHRSVRPDLNILLTEYDRPFFRDYLLPMGRLRESRSGARRSDLLIVTKCPNNIGKLEMEFMVEQLNRYVAKEVPIFFSCIEHQEPVQFGGRPMEGERFLLVTGIATSKPLFEYAQRNLNLVGHIEYPDHRKYGLDDISRIVRKSQSYGGNPGILTTEKDMVKMIDPGLEISWKGLPRFYLPIKTRFLANEDRLQEMIFSVLSP